MTQNIQGIFDSAADLILLQKPLVMLLISHFIVILSEAKDLLRP